MGHAALGTGADSDRLTVLRINHGIGLSIFRSDHRDQQIPLRALRQFLIFRHDILKQGFRQSSHRCAADGNARRKLPCFPSVSAYSSDPSAEPDRSPLRFARKISSAFFAVRRSDYTVRNFLDKNRAVASSHSSDNAAKSP